MMLLHCPSDKELLAKPDPDQAIYFTRQDVTGAQP